MGLIRDVRLVSRNWRWTHRPLVPRSAELPSREPREFPTAWARSDWAIAARSKILEWGFDPLIRHEVSLRVERSEILDGLEPPVIFIANHSSHLDAPTILISLPEAWRERTAVGAAADYFFDVWWRAVGTTLAFNTFPVERGGSRRSPGLGKRLLAQGWNLLIFPEGTRSKDGWMAGFKLGTANLSLSTGAPVIPVGVGGTYQAMPKGRGWPAPGRPPVAVRFGDPITPRPDEDASALSARLRRALLMTMQEERTTWWDALRKDRAGQLPDGTGPDAPEWRRVWESSRAALQMRSRVFQSRR